MIEICTVGGYNEVGKNMTAVKVDDEVVILDMGLSLEKYIAYTEDEDIYDLSPNKLIRVGAVPDVSLISDWKDKVKAIIPTHAHLDHIGAIPFLSNSFKAQIICAPYTKAVLSEILKGENITLKNRIVAINPNSSFQLSKGIKVEFINMTHSIPQTVVVALHTKYGVIVYANDFKFDNTPVLGKKPNYEKLAALKKKGVLCLILDSIYSKDARKTPSEKIAREMLREVLFGLKSKKSLIIVTTFSSHLARLKSIIEFGKKLKRKIIFCGRSLYKYVKAGEDTQIINFSGDVEIVKFRKHVIKKLKTLKSAEERSKVLLVVTGHQGEPKAVLPRMAYRHLPFNFEPGDFVIFSSSIIPTNINIANRSLLERSLKDQGVRIFKDVHVSGHAAKEDQRDLISLLKPKHIIPAHGDINMASSLAELGKEMGYRIGKDVHIMGDGLRLKLNNTKPQKI